MKSRDEFDGIIEDLIEVQLRALKVSIKHYHADGGAELISKKVLKLLKSAGTTYSWNPADTPELNATSERKFRTVSMHVVTIRTLSGLLVGSLSNQ